ncbi:MAG TPA: hypothetical protein VFV07_06710 [Rhizomicrobium sp.]|nr:hypothetical protein [Rhizomicrobium sp.]
MGTALLFAALGALGWAYLLYPDEDDPKSLRYVLWKHDLVSIDLDRAAYVIADDPDGKRDLVIGQTKAQLHARFGFLLTPHEAGPTLERCIQGSWADKKDALHLRHSDMIVVFENGIATDASVLKPC